MSDQKSLRVAVIGAGASGIMACIKLRAAGINDVVIYEKASQLGGTWRDNRYPGITCDVPSHAYRYSFAPNPDWSFVCSPGSEIQNYLVDIAHRYDVERCIRYEQEIILARYQAGQWTVQTTAGGQDQYDAILCATGPLHHPVMPDIEGLESFAGPAFHTARWDDSVDLTAKRVGIIGTGSTATQIVGAVVDQVKSLTLFQRTAQWILPLPNRAYTDEEKAQFKAQPDTMASYYAYLNDRFHHQFAAAVVGENPPAYEEMVRACEEHLQTVHDAQLRAKLTPDYQVACKRLVMSDLFYPAIQKPNAHLVTEPIVRVSPRGVVTAIDNLHELDVLVLATGFDTHRFCKPMRVIGDDGLTLAQAWAERNEGYLTVAIPHFPNFFMIGGPNSPIGNFSWLVIAETQCDYIVQLLDRLRAHDIRSIAPKTQATRDFNDGLRAAMPNTVWASGCASWYLDKNGEPASWPWGFDRFSGALSAPDWADFELT